MTFGSGHSAAIEAAAARRSAETLWFENPLNGYRVRVRKQLWRAGGFLTGPLALLIAGLWGNALACLAACIAGAALMSIYAPTVPKYLLPIGAVWGVFTPELLIRKYLRSGWREVTGDAQPQSGDLNRS